MLLFVYRSSSSSSSSSSFVFFNLLHYHVLDMISEQPLFHFALFFLNLKKREGNQGWFMSCITRLGKLGHGSVGFHNHK